MAPGTRSRRPEVLRRATPVMLKPKQRQTTLDHHLQQTRPQSPAATPFTRPPPSQTPSQAPSQARSRSSRESRALQQHKTPAARHAYLGHHTAPTAPKQQQTTPPSRQQTLSFAVPSKTLSPPDTINHAESMSAARPKRKAAVDADADAHDGDAAKRAKTVAASASGRSSSVSAVKGPDAIRGTGIMAHDDSLEDLEEAIRKRPRLAVEIIDYAEAPTALLQKHQQQHSIVSQGSHKPKHSTTTLHPRPLSPLSPPALRSLAVKKPSAYLPDANTNALPTSSSNSDSRQHSSAAAQKVARDTADPSTLPHTSAASSTNSSATTTTQPRALKAAPKADLQPASSKAKEKLVHGIKHELKSLQLAATDAVDVASTPREGGRKLRSQEATRFKSELSAYFPEYDEVIGNEPKEEHVLNVDTPIILVEQSVAYPAQHLSPVVSTTPPATSLRSGDHIAASPSSVKGYGDKLFYDVFDSHVLDFTFLGSQHKNKGAVDPLPDACFEANHKRAERMERSIRNTEKGRAQHEKDQIIRLLDGLLGPDWLRTMGVSGITESKKKAFEPARDHFIRGCRTILDKFRSWSLEEKRRKVEKDRAHAEEVKAREAAAASTAAPCGKGKAKPDTVGGKARKRREVSGKEVASKKIARAKSARDDAASTSEPIDTDGDEAAAAGAAAVDNEGDEDGIDDDSQPDSSDFDAVIALQLREEALARSRVASKLSHTPPTSSNSKRRKMQKPHEPPLPAEDAKDAKDNQDAKEVKSFFEKPYQREAALSRSRRKGRTVMAWGQPVPEPPQIEFSLPDEVMDQDDEPKETGRRTRGNIRSANR